MPEFALTDPIVIPFLAIPAVLVLLLLWGVEVAGRRLGEPPAVRRRALLWTALIAVAWMSITWIAADSGVLGRWDLTPPPFLIVPAVMVFLALALVLGRSGERLATGLPLWTLVAVQSFRFPLETAMHSLYESGIMPVQMSYSGRNFDIVTGICALILVPMVRRGRGRLLVAAWNVMGLLLLLNVVTIAIASTPMFATFGDNRLNVFVASPPFVWLPAIMVLAAFAGHLLIFRALAAKR